MCPKKDWFPGRFTATNTLLFVIFKKYIYSHNSNDSADGKPKIDKNNRTVEEADT